MRKIKDLTQGKEKVYIILKTEEIQKKFMSDAEKEGITFSDGESLKGRKCEDVMVLYNDGTLRYLGWAGRILFRNMKEKAICVDYEKIIDEQ